MKEKSDDCLTCGPTLLEDMLPSKDNCTQQIPQVRLDPTTRVGASCAGCGKYFPDDVDTPLFLLDETYE